MLVFAREERVRPVDVSTFVPIPAKVGNVSAALDFNRKKVL